MFGDWASLCNSWQLCVFINHSYFNITDGNTDGKFICSTAVASAVLDWGSIRPWQHTFRLKLIVTLSCQQLNSAMLTFRNNVALTKVLFTSKPPLKNIKMFLRYKFHCLLLGIHVFISLLIGFAFWFKCYKFKLDAWCFWF